MAFSEPGPGDASAPHTSGPGGASSPRSIIRGYFGETPWESLHALPTLYVVGGCTLAFMGMTFFLQRHVFSPQDHWVLFGFGSFTVFCAYFMIYHFLTEYSSSFKRISQDKQFYTISNMIKAGVLAAITPFAVHQLIQIVLHDKWDNNLLKNLGCIYAIPDFVSLIVVRRMATTTIVHHLCVVLFNYFSIHNDYNEENVCRLIVVYAAFSTFGYVVYMLLASRFLGVSPAVSRLLSLVALVVYVVCCATNWTWQATYLRRLLTSEQGAAVAANGTVVAKAGGVHWTIWVYMVLIAFVMWDDLTLNRWLLLNVRNVHGLHYRRGIAGLRGSGGSGSRLASRSGSTVAGANKGNFPVTTPGGGGGGFTTTTTGARPRAPNRIAQT